MAFALACALCACSETPELRSSNPRPDGVEFVEAVYPLLLRDCSFAACHGANERFLQIYGPGRNRLDPDTHQDDPMLLEEVMYSYDRARSMLGTAANPSDSLLLRKPLEIAAGGQSHRGADALGRNVFLSRSSDGYSTLHHWAGTFGDPPQPEDVDMANATASQAVLDWLNQ